MLKNLLKLTVLITVFTLIFQACGEKDKVEKTFTITYDLNGGAGTPPTSQVFKAGGNGITLHDGAGLTKTGFAFGGWSEKARSNLVVSSPYRPSSNVTLYAIWNPVYIVAYDLNGGAGTPPASQVFKVGGEGITLSSGGSLTKTGFAFGGWSEKSNTTAVVSSPYTPLSNVTLYAIWNAVYTVSYDINRGSGNTPESQTYTQGGTGITLNDGAGLKRTGFTFGGWTETADGKTAITSPFKPLKNTRIYAIWTGTANATTYTISYNINGGTGTTPQAQTYSGTAVALNNGSGLTKTNFTFSGWGDSAGSTAAVANPFTPTKDITLYAIWTANTTTYTISYNINGGTGTTPPAQTYSGTAVALNNGSGLTKTNFTFSGWGDSAGSTAAVANPFTPTKDITLYAIWTANTTTYTISYNINGGTGTTPPAQTYSGTAVALNNGSGLTKTNFTFSGWGDSAGSTAAVANPFTPTKDITLYAIWTANTTTYTITYNINGGTGTTPPAQTYSGTAVALNNGSGLTKTNFTFSGWGDATTSTTAVTNPFTPTRDITLYAIWTANTTTYTITYNINGGTGTTPPAQTYSGTAVALNNGSGLTKTNFTFSGWGDSAGSTAAVANPFTPTRDITLYAIWTANTTTYTISYNINGGTGTTPENQTYTGGNGITLPATIRATRQGYTFAGWVTSSTGTTVLTSPYVPTATITLYAYWRQNAAAEFRLTSATYPNGEAMPPRCGGLTNTSPQLSWTGAPTTNVVKYILVFFDATINQWHFRREIDTNVSNLAEGAIPGGFSGSDYFGPDPGLEQHTYEFKLYAVRTGYTLANFGSFFPLQRSWTDLETANSAYIVGASNIYSGTYKGEN